MRLRASSLLCCAVLALASACGTSSRRAGREAAQAHRDDWSVALACTDAATCLAAVERPRYAPAADIERMVQRLSGFGERIIPALAKELAPGTPHRRREVATAALLSHSTSAARWARGASGPDAWRTLVLLALESNALPLVRDALSDRLPANREWLADELAEGSSTETENRALAVLRLLGRKADGETEPICGWLAQASRRDWQLARNAAAALGWIGNPAAVGCLTGALDVPSWRVNNAALAALARLGPDALSARSAVLRVATTHWSQRVRWRAVIALRFLREGAPRDESARLARYLATGGTVASFLRTPLALEEPVSAAFARVSPNDSRAPADVPLCAGHRRPGAPVLIEHAGAKRRLEPVPSAAARQRLSAYARRLPNVTLERLGIGFDVSLTHATRDAIEARGGLLAATCAGELGGGLVFVPRSGEPAALASGCFVGFAASPLGTLALEGKTHGELGRVFVIVQADEGPRIAPFVDLPGEPIAIRGGSTWPVLVATSLGDVVLGPEGISGTTGCEPP